MIVSRDYLAQTTRETERQGTIEPRPRYTPDLSPASTTLQ